MEWVEALTEQGLPKADAQARAIAAQIWAEMLGMVCHPEYYRLGDQKVSSLIHPLPRFNTQAFVVHFSGFHASIYYATFPSTYLSTIQNEGISALPSKFPTPLTLHHTAPANLLDADSRLVFLKDFIAVVRCLADGGAPIGYLRRDAGKIHRGGSGEEDMEEILKPPQECLDEREMWQWRQENVGKYAL